MIKMSCGVSSCPCVMSCGDHHCSKEAHQLVGLGGTSSANAEQIPCWIGLL